MFAYKCINFSPEEHHSEQGAPDSGSPRTAGGKDGGKKAPSNSLGITFGLNMPLGCHRELLDEPNNLSSLPSLPPFAFLSSVQATL